MQVTCLKVLPSCYYALRIGRQLVRFGQTLFPSKNAFRHLSWRKAFSFLRPSRLCATAREPGRMTLWLTFTTEMGQMQSRRRFVYGSHLGNFSLCGSEEKGINRWILACHATRYYPTASSLGRRSKYS
jgi:hypothetical protein